MTTNQIDVNKQTDNQNQQKNEGLNKSNVSINKTTEDQKDKEEKQEFSESKTNLIINYIPPNMNEGQLASLFSPYGTMENIKIVNDPQTGRSRGYGFIKYELEESAIKALKALNGAQAGNKRLKVAFARPKCKEIQNANLYITNIPTTWTEQKLQPLFEGFGKMVECRILRDEESKSRGVGFVRMDTHMNAIKAMEARDKFKPDGNDPPLQVKLAQRRNNRRWQNVNNMNNRNNRSRNMNNLGKIISGSGTTSSQYMSDYTQRMNNRQSPRNTGKYYRQRGNNNNNQFNNNNNNNNSSRQHYRPRNTTNDNTNTNYYGQMNDYFNSTSVTTNQLQQTSTNPQTSTNNNSSGQRNLGNNTFNIITYNIPSSYNVDHLIQLYAPYGPIQSVNIQKPQPNSKNGNQQAYGVISYFYYDDAERAQQQTHGKRVGDRRLEVVFQQNKM